MRTLLFFMLLTLAVPGVCQHPKKAMKAYETAQKAFMQRDYQRAMEQVKKCVGHAPDYSEAWLLLGEIGMETRDYEIAQEGYERALAVDSMLFPPAALTLARIYDQKMRYADEVKLVEWFQQAASGNQANDEKASRMLDQARFRENAVSHPVDFHPVNLGEGINTVNDEYVNALDLTGSTYLFTRKTAAAPDRDSEEGIVIAHGVDGEWYSSDQKLYFNDALVEQAGAAFQSYDGKELFFTICGYKRHGSGCDLYRADRDGANGNWLHVEYLGDVVNSTAWDSQPCLSLDGSELFFTSRRNGNADLYHCYRDENGQWSEPESLGSVINTKGTEMAPFLHPDGKTLYFSSDTHLGMGGYDLFVSRRDEAGVWSEPVNLGYPINTPGDEINFIVAADGHTALISSVREGGFGGYDIYSFQLKEEDIKPEAVNVYDFLVEELAPGAVVQLVNIHFEFNSAALTEDSEEGVEMLFEFLASHPEISVELAGHTDNVGSDAYNMKLSEDRAEVVRKALLDKGVEEGRLTAKGYGSTKPIYPNDNEEHRALNRRTELIIVNRIP